MTAGVAPRSVPTGHDDVDAALWNALLVLARKAAGTQDSREAKDYADAAKDFADAITQLDPSLISPQGVPPEVLARSIPQPQPSGGSEKKES